MRRYRRSCSASEITCLEINFPFSKKNFHGEFISIGFRSSPGKLNKFHAFHICVLRPPLHSPPSSDSALQISTLYCDYTVTLGCADEGSEREKERRVDSPGKHRNSLATKFSDLLHALLPASRVLNFNYFIRNLLFVQSSL